MADIKYPKKRGEIIVLSVGLCELWQKSNKLRNPTTNRPLKSTSKTIKKIEKDLYDSSSDFKGYLYFHDFLSQNNCEEIKSNINKNYGIDTKFLTMESGIKVLYGNMDMSVVNKMSISNTENPFYRI